MSNPICEVGESLAFLSIVGAVIGGYFLLNSILLKGDAFERDQTIIKSYQEHILIINEDTIQVKQEKKYPWSNVFYIKTRNKNIRAIDSDLEAGLKIDRVEISDYKNPTSVKIYEEGWFGFRSEVLDSLETIIADKYLPAFAKATQVSR